MGWNKKGKNSLSHLNPPFFLFWGEKAVDEQEANDRFVRLVGGVRKADRLQQIWRNSYPSYRKSREEVFREEAKREGFSDRAIEAFLKLP